MINAKGFTAVIRCNTCEKVLSEGAYPADAEDNLPTDALVISHDGQKNNEHYCPDCKFAKQSEEIEEMDAVLGVCRRFIEAGDVPSAIKHFYAEMKCSQKDAIETVGAESIFYKSIHELRD